MRIIKVISSTWGSIPANAYTAEAQSCPHPLFGLHANMLQQIHRFSQASQGLILPTGRPRSPISRSACQFLYLAFMGHFEIFKLPYGSPLLRRAIIFFGGPSCGNRTYRQFVYAGSTPAGSTLCIIVTICPISHFSHFCLLTQV